MNKDLVQAPFSKDQVKNINAIQDKVGLMTCMGKGRCERDKKTNYGILKATESCLTCSCGKYHQTWVPKGFDDGTMLNVQIEFEKTFSPQERK